MLQFEIEEKRQKKYDRNNKKHSFPDKKLY